MTLAAKLDSSQTLTTTMNAAASSNQTGRSVFSTVPIGSVAYASHGTATSIVANTIMLAEVFIPRNFTATGIGFLINTAGNGAVLVSLFNSAGTKVASNSASVVTAGSNAFQQVAFSSTYAASGPARYWIGIQLASATDQLRLIAASTYVDCFTKLEAQGGFAVPASITPPTSFSALTGPIAYVY